MSQASYNAIVASSKLMAIAGVVILGVGWFMVPSCEEKIRKMEVNGLCSCNLTNSNYFA